MTPFTQPPSMEYKILATFVKILLYIVVCTQLCVLAVLLVESMLPCIDVVFNHIFHLVFKPYLTLIWNKLFNWIVVYIAMGTLVLLFIKDRVERNGETKPSELATAKPSF